MQRPEVFRYMTIGAYAIGCDQTLAAAHTLMKQRRIRHLPVMQGGVVVGVLSERDVLYLESREPVNALAMTVDQAMATDLYTAAPDALIDEVAEALIQRHLSAAVVVDGSRLLGVISTVDILRALVDLVAERRADSDLGIS